MLIFIFIFSLLLNLKELGFEYKEKYSSFISFFAESLKVFESSFWLILLIFENKKSFCIYNDDVATEFDSSVIKEIESGCIKSVLILGYSKLSKFEINYQILSRKDKRTYENTHSIFETDGEQIDEKGHLFSYILKVENDKGYIVGLENISNIKYKLRLKLEGLNDIDAEFIGKKNPEFEMFPNSKKVFNLLINFESDICSFDFEFV